VLLGEPIYFRFEGRGKLGDDEHGSKAGSSEGRVGGRSAVEIGGR